MQQYSVIGEGRWWYQFVEAVEVVEVVEAVEVVEEVVEEVVDVVQLEVEVAVLLLLSWGPLFNIHKSRCVRLRRVLSVIAVNMEHSIFGVRPGPEISENVNFSTVELLETNWSIPATVDSSLNLKFLSISS